MYHMHRWQGMGIGTKFPKGKGKNSLFFGNLNGREQGIVNHYVNVAMKHDKNELLRDVRDI